MSAAVLHFPAPMAVLWLYFFCRGGLDVRDPKLGRLIWAARDALHAMSIELHYQGCGHGVGRPPAG